jgi:predicted aspartyl protease
MGTFHVDAVIKCMNRPKFVAVPKMLIDTGSEFSWISEGTLKLAGIGVAKKDVTFVMANGKPVTRNTGYAIIRVDKYETVDEVVFGLPGDLTLLGARTMEGFGVIIDPRRKKLLPGDGHMAARSSVD